MDAKNLTNTPFDFTIGERTFQIRRANLEKAILYQAKLKELLEKKDSSSDLRIAAYCVWLVVHAVDETITEQWVIDNLPADIDVQETLITLGFMNQKQVETLRKLQNSLGIKT